MNKSCLLACAAFLGCGAFAFERLFCLCMCRGSKLRLASFAHLKKEYSQTLRAIDRDKSEIDSVLSSAKKSTLRLRLNKEGINLYADCYEQESNKWVLIAHGYGGSGKLMEYAAKEFYLRGYNILLPDLRAHGKSGGKYVGWGYVDKKDIEKWCERIRQHCPNAEIVLYGVSMGGAAVLMAAADKKIKGLRCVVSDCAYTSLEDIMRYRIRRMLHLPPCLVMCTVRPMCRLKAHICTKSVSVVNKIKEIDVPVMLCHGDRDRFVPTDNALELYAAANRPKRLMLVHGAGHGVSAFVCGKRYWDRIFDFIDKHKQSKGCRV